MPHCDQGAVDGGGVQRQRAGGEGGLDRVLGRTLVLCRRLLRGADDEDHRERDESPPSRGGGGRGSVHAITDPDVRVAHELEFHQRLSRC